MQYCHNCGKKMLQIGVKFCPHCGTNLTSLNAQPPKEEPPEVAPSRRQNTFKPYSRPLVPRPASVDFDDDDYDPYEGAEGINVNISELEVDIGRTNQGKDTIGGLMAQGPTNEERRHGQALTSDEAIKSLEKEGGALRPKSTQRQNTQDEE